MPPTNNPNPQPDALLKLTSRPPAILTFAVLTREQRGESIPNPNIPPAPGSESIETPLEIPPGAALVRNRRTRETFLACDLRETTREVSFEGQLVHEDSQGVRLYPSRPRRLTRARAEILARNTGGSR